MAAHMPPQPPLAQNIPPRTYSPYSNAPSPIQPPHPNKRPRLSPNPTSPYGTYTTSPTTPSLSLPQAPTPMNFGGPPLPFNHPLPHPQNLHSVVIAQGTMGPPQRPADRTDKPEKEDINETLDMLNGVGINLREEEDALGYIWNKNGNVANAGAANEAGAFDGDGPYRQPATSTLQSIVEQTNKHRKTAARAHAELQAAHLKNPFLLTNCVRNRLHKHAYEHHAKLDVTGLYDRIPEPVSGHTLTDKQHGDGVAEVRAPSILDQDSPLAGVLSIISLATEARLRDVQEDAYKSSRNRELYRDGVVHPDFADIAFGQGKATQTTTVPASVTQTSWDNAPDSAVSPMIVDPKRRRSSSTCPRLPTPPTENPPTPKSTIAFPNPLIARVNAISQADLKAEEARIARRKARQQQQAQAAKAASAIEKATPKVEPPKLKQPTKKERDAMAKANQTEDVLHRNSNITANMALGGGKSYSWLSAGAGGKPGLSSRSGTSTPRTVSGATASAQNKPTADKGLQGQTTKWGEKRKADTMSRHITTNDLLQALDASNERKVKAKVMLLNPDDKKRV